MRAAGLFLLAALASGCYESSSGREDGAMDPGQDPIHDTAVDSEPEVYPDCQGSTGVTVSYEIDSYWINLDREAACTVGSFSFNEEQTEIFLALECIGPDGTEERCAISIHASTGIPIYLIEGQEVVFNTVSEMAMMYPNGWFALYSSERQLLLAGLRADALSPHDTLPDQWYQPLDVSEASGLCPLEPSPCSDDERIALDVTSDDATLRIFDGNAGFVGLRQAYKVVVETAMIYNDMQCVDTPRKWFSAVIASIPLM